jgi:hypothetical protein
VVSPSLFEQAARAFDGWRDPATGARVLKLDARGGRPENAVLQTVYQQCACFLEGGRKVLVRTGTEFWWCRLGGETCAILDLATGEVSDPFPAGHYAVEVNDRAGTALLVSRGEEPTVRLWDLRAGRELASVGSEGWQFGGAALLSDGRRALVSHYFGCPYGEAVSSHFHLLAHGEPARVVLEAERFYCNHIQGCPTDPELFAYDRWPSPKRDVDQVIHVASLDGSFHGPARLDARALRPADQFGARDHYLWTQDGRRIVSYLTPQRAPKEMLVGDAQSRYAADFNHFKFPWVLSALDWRTGEDLAAPYPPGRWGCHMGVTPDSRRIVSAGGPGFDFLYSVDIEGLREGWNERVICAYPETRSKGINGEPFAFPFVLPDGSGVLFNAGWPGPEHGLYLVEWACS